MLVLNMNSKRQRRPNVRLWEVGDIPAAFSCGVSQRINENLGQRRWKDDSARNDESGNNDNSGCPKQFTPEIGFLDMQDNRENKNPNSLKLVSDVSGQDELNVSKGVLSFGGITRKSRLMKRRRRSLDSLFLDPWGSRVPLTRNVGDFTSKSSFSDTKEACRPDISMQVLQSLSEHCDEAEMSFPLEPTISSVGEWLERFGFRKYAELFELHEVDEETLPLLTLDDLKEMGILAVGIRRKFFNAIKTLGEGNVRYLLDEHI